MSKRTEDVARGMRYGTLIAALDSAKDALVRASTCWDLLSPEDRELLQKASDIVNGVEQRVSVASEFHKKYRAVRLSTT